jgi:hypothetical protein
MQSPLSGIISQNLTAFCRRDRPKMKKNVVSLNSRLKTIHNEKKRNTDLSIVARLRRCTGVLLVLAAHRNRVAITSNTRVLRSRVLAGCLALEHLAVLGDAVALALGNGVLAVEGLALCGCPGKVVAADLDVIVGELAELVVVHAEELCLLRGAQVQAGDLVDDEGEDGRDGERIGGNGDNVCDLLVDCLGATGQGACGQTVVDAVEADDVVGAEKAVEEESPHAGDTVLSEDIEGIVDLDPELDCWLLVWVTDGIDDGLTLGGEVRNDSGGDAKNDAAPGSQETGGGRGSDKTRDDTGAPADHGPLASQAPIEENPGHGGKHGSKVAVPAGHDGTKVGAESRAAVEAEPAEPQEDGAESDERDVVGTEVEHHLLLTTAKDHRVCEGRASRNNLDGAAASVVHASPLEEPSV